MDCRPRAPVPPSLGAGRFDTDRGAAGPLRTAALAIGVAMVAIGVLPDAAQAHGPIAPAASSYFAKVLGLPPGLDAKVVDGDLRMWLSVPASETLVVVDYRGAPYLRFSRAGVEVNRNSSMYFLNQTPVAQTPPSYITASTPPNWHRVSDGHAYEWHDGRLHALATVALSPGRVVRRPLDDPVAHQRPSELDLRRAVACR